MIAPPAGGCVQRIPPQLRDDVPGVELPDGSQGSLEIAFDGQTGQLDQSNDEKGTIIWICENYEAERAEAARQSKPRSWLQKLTPWAE